MHHRKATHMERGRRNVFCLQHEPAEVERGKQGASPKENPRKQTGRPKEKAVRTSEDRNFHRKLMAWRRNRVKLIRLIDEHARKMWPELFKP